MAKFSNASGSLYLNVYIEPGAQNIAANTTVVNWRMTVSRTGAYLTRNEQGDSTLSLDINGGRVHTSNPRWRTSGEEFLMASGSTTVGHNADGTKSFPFSATFNPNNGLHGVITVSGKISLTTIPRSSSISVEDGAIGSPIDITIERASPTFTHVLRYGWGDKKEVIAPKVATSYSWTIPMDFANDIPNNVSGECTIYIDTYNGNEKIGTQQEKIKVTLPSNVKPTFTSLTLTDANTAARALLSGNNFLQIISDIQVGFNGAVGSYGSTIAGYRAEIVNRNLSTNSNGGRLGMMNFNGSATIRASVVDSRGRWSDTKDVTINVIEYFAPILSYTAQRTRQTPNIIQIVRNAKIAPITLSGSQKNIMTLSFKVAPLGSTSYTADNGSASGSWTTQNTLTNSAANMAGNYPANKSFTIIGTLSDKFTSVEFSATVATESVVMSYDKDNRFAVGKIVDTNLPKGSIESTGGYYLNGKPIQNYALTSLNGASIARYNEDLNHITEPGFYIVNTSMNIPVSGRTYYYLEVIRHASNVSTYVMQRATCRTHTQQTYVRLCEDGTWGRWKEQALGDHPNLINTDWQSAGFPGTYYKRVGDILTIKYDFTGNGGTMTIGNIPSNVWVAPQSYMLIIAKWSISGSDNSHVQINQGTGGLNVLSTGNGVVYRGQLTIMI
ncbi:TPA: hypothetical protein U1578_001411 [Streptococcus suis]|nr:hypothetical protein [Streptococcus suis]NQO06225.1 hypothetical protein [Streptococcus suis]NQO36668.1 hypothetical protein [Streptococcus suis]NQO74799.1 hypothetical protein [Streptococcus suis]HEM5432366.1 hypothetical protein [Streptococcus suis]